MIEWFRRLFRRDDVDAEPEASFETKGEGFPMPASLSGEIDSFELSADLFQEELARLRWAAQHEAVSVADGDVDPELWSDQRPAFEFERALAHAHEGFRDRLASRVATAVQAAATAVFVSVEEVADRRLTLEATDRDLVKSTRDRRRLYADLEGDPLELGRYYRLRSPWYQGMKWGLGIVFVLSEWFISATVFNQILPFDNALFGFGFSAGLMVFLVAVPHFAALGLKEGLTTHHAFEHKDHHERKQIVPWRLSRNLHFEEVDDRWFRFLSALGVLILIALVIPVSFLRSTETRDENFGWILAFFFILQAGLSFYFFLREWLDHGAASSNYHKLVKYWDNDVKARDHAEGDYLDALHQYHIASDRLISIVHQIPRWDNYLVQAYLETIHYFRHVLVARRPELAPFVTWARVPFLGRSATSAHQDYVLDPVAAENPTLDEDNLMGREWLMRRMVEALSESPLDETFGKSSRDTVNWMLTKSPHAMLEKFLSRYFDLDVTYRMPDELEVMPLTREDAEEPPEVEESDDDGDPATVRPLSPKPHPPDDSEASGDHETG